MPEENKTECTECSLGCCKECPNDECTVCNGVDVNYPQLSLEEALKKVQEDLNSPASSAYKIYYIKNRLFLGGSLIHEFNFFLNRSTLIPEIHIKFNMLKY